MRKSAVPILLTGLAAVSLAWANHPAEQDDDVAVVLSPSTLVLGSGGTWVTAHTNLPYGSVDLSTVRLEGLAPGMTKADDCGMLVAKFAQSEVEAIVAPPSATLTLSGSLKDGTAFAAADTIRVIEAGKP